VKSVDVGSRTPYTPCLSPWVACLIFAVLPTLSSAFPITYSISGVGSGNVGVTTFTNAPYTIILSGDTKTIQLPDTLDRTRNAIGATIRIDSIGTAVITEPLLIESACGATPGIGVARGASFPFSSYVLGASRIPISACALTPVAPTLNLSVSLTNFVNVASTLGPITMTSSSAVDYGAQEATFFTATPLGTLGSSVAYSINSVGEISGVVAVNAGTGGHAFRYSGSSMTDLGTLGGQYSYGFGINDSGTVVGSSDLANGTTSHAFVYAGGTMQDLGIGGPGDNGASGINSAGQMTGNMVTTDNTLHAFLYSGGVTQDLGTLGGDLSTGAGINDQGEITGQSRTADGFNSIHAFIYSSGTMRDLGTLGGSISMGVGIDARGDVAGYSDTPADAAIHAFLYADNIMLDLGTLGGSYSAAQSINDNGWLVGQSQTADGSYRAFLYSGGIMQDLDTLIEPELAGQAVEGAHGVNNKGQIAATACDDDGQNCQAYRLDPISLTPAATSTSLASGTNPSVLGTPVTFFLGVTGDVPTGSVSIIRNDSLAPIASCLLDASFVAAIAQCHLSTTIPSGQVPLAAVYSGDAHNASSRSGILLQVVDEGNFALSTAGGVASASSTISTAFPVSAINNNERGGFNWGNGGGWNDGTGNAFPDWVQINFNGSKTINRVVVYTVQDNYSFPIEPTDTLTFTQWGITDFTIQGWSGATWVTLGTVAGNNLVKRTVTFPPYTTTRIRINVTNARASYSRITEVEAWGTAATGPPPSTTTLTSSLNPSTVGASITFTATVVGTAPAGSVNFTDGGTSIGGCSAMTLTGSGNSKTAQCATAALAAATHSIVAHYSGDSANAASTSTPLSEVVNAGGSINVALAGNGGVATASSTISHAFPVSSINNNERGGLNWGNGGGWNDASGNTYPDWVQIVFNGSKTIDHVVIYTLQDNYANPIEPTDTQTFSLYGVTAFTVQGKQGKKWITLATVVGNNLVKRTVNFAPFATDRIRINVTNTLASYSRITEVEAWGN
jgi:probable HAF family extracellular repeat protein